ncbi:D-Ala-D-Ala carboxypeptidase family metallohydrolase [Acinetobacter bereziniae]|uniref:D-Ala-D-Ala carboxypeptidase family metallohydrolase n=1 Tax=Acinetobacter bereziniae TaxID=106648 RepID=UPI0021D0B9BB
MKNSKLIFIIIGCISWVALNGCTPSEKNAEHSSSSKKTSEQQIEQQFKVWKAQQDPHLLADYYQFISQYLKHPPSLMELTTTRNYMPEQCYPKRFAVPPKAYWKNVVSSLQLVEKLNRNGYFKTYTITAIYRAPELNKCVGGAGKSKHLSNYAVDFHVLSPKETVEKDRELLIKKMCHFWKVEGKNYKMGLGVYGNNRYHIDTQGYRTWGKDYKSKSSVCLKN